MAKRDSESAKFLAVGQPFQFRVAPPGMVDDEEGVLEDGKLMIGTEEPVEVTTLSYKRKQRVRNDDGTLETREMEFENDLIARCREYCVTGRLTEVKDDTDAAPKASRSRRKAEATE
jgi:hypothetical protein